MTTIRCLSLLLLVLAFAGFDRKQPGMSVSFHVETNARDTDTFAIPVHLNNPPRESFIEKMASITDREIAGIYPFPAADGSWGCAFKLDPHGRIWLESLSSEKSGLALVAMVNGRQVIDLLIDRRVSSGIITIPYGLTAQDIQILSKKLKVLGKKKK